MEKIQDLKYPYGNFARSGEKIEPNMKKMQFLVNGGAKLQEAMKIEEGGGQSSQSYGLRENPKKTLRGFDDGFPLPQDKVCKQCGKVFQSMKALCGHMAFHSEKKQVMDSDSDTEFEERKPRSKANGKRCNRFTTKSSAYSLANGSSSVSEIGEKDQEEIAICLMMLSRDYASCRGGVNSVVESSDNISAVLETKSRLNEMRNTNMEGRKYVYNEDKKLNYCSSMDAEMVQQENSGYFLDDVSMSETEKGVKVQGYTHQERGTDNGRIAIKTWKNESKKGTKELLADDDDELVVESYKRIKYGSAYAEVLSTHHKKSKYECMNCKRSFKSFQALGGHRPCHKRNNANDVAEKEQILKSGEFLGNKKGVSKEVMTSRVVKKVRSKKQKGHLCPFCPRVFKSGQALGGHKRSHFLVGNPEITNQSPEIKPVVHDLFDLNLPAPQEDDDDDNNAQFDMW